MKRSPILLLVLFAFGCASAPPAPPMTPEQAAWFTARDGQSLLFDVPAEMNETAWNRAKIWLATYGDFKLQTIDATILETYSPPPEAAVRYGYQVLRQQLPSGAWRFTVRCSTGNSMAGHIAQAMGRSLAYYISTGVDCPGCGGGRLGNPSHL